ncbi:Spy/CpxP family protein refolding chaperone [Sphingomonas sp. MMS24-J13]|uniref:Spy/CpxP family protein refolding chaperone n=1 Tax=Sphingomonas sp. MMS24-J13 TaxID=3238686 RepID=UPI00384F84C5
MTRGRWLLLVVIVTGVAAFAGAWLGRTIIGPPAEPPETALHRVLYHDLALTEDQRRRLAVLNRGYADRKEKLEAAMRADNAVLASAMASEHGYGPQVGQAVDRLHHDMGALQKATLEHVFAMRGLLDAGQTARYDQAVAKALTAPAN